jgi:hypothetical protein
MTIQAALAGGVEGKPIRRKLVALRVKEQDARRRRFERAKSEGDLPNDADAADLARFVTAIYQGHGCAGDQRRKSRGSASPC